MSTETEDKIVRMQMDISNFEPNANKAMSLLDKLKEKLTFKNADEGLKNINYQMQNINFDRMAYSLDNISSKLSNLNIVGASVINNLTNKVTNFVTSTLKSLTVDQLSAGWKKYEDKVGSVQTIMASTGKSIDAVNKELEQLMWFTDETSYNFTDMTNNIGKFTAAGVELHTAVEAMQGISTWAAISGQNATGAGRAMYNLSQAIGNGVVQLIDWKSIQNVNMATKDFNNAVLESAADLGTLKKVSEDTYETTKGTIVNYKNLAYSLDEKWFTSDVLLKSLEKYGKFSTELYKYTEQYDITATDFLIGLKAYKAGTKSINDIAKQLGINAKELKPIFEQLGSAEYEIGYKAFLAGQQAKTFTDMVNALKDAVSTKIMTTYENIFGNYEEAAELWTKITENLYSVFTLGMDERNRILALWKIGGGRDNIFQVLFDTYDSIVNIASKIYKGFRKIIPKKTASDLLLITTLIKQFGDSLNSALNSKEVLKKFQNIGKGIGSIVKIIKDALTVLIYVIKPFVKLFFGSVKVAFTVALNILNSISNVFNKLNDTLTKSGIYESIVTIVNGFVELSKLKINELIEKLTPSIQKMYLSLTELKNAFNILIKPIKDFVKSHLFKSVGNEAEISLNAFNAVAKVFDFIGKVIEKVIDIFTFLIETITNTVNYFNENDTFSKIKEIGVNIIYGLIAGIKEKASSIYKTVSAFVTTIIETIKDKFGIHSPSTVMISIGKYLLEGLLIGLQGITSIITFIIKTVTGMALQIASAINDVLVSINNAIGPIMDSINAILNTIASKIDVSSITNIVIKIGSAIIDSLGTLFALLVNQLGKIKPYVALLIKGIFNIALDVIKIIYRALLLKEILKIISAKAFDKFANGLKGFADSIKELAISLAILAGSLLLISLIPKDKLESSLKIFGILLGSIVSVAIAASGINKKFDLSKSADPLFKDILLLSLSMVLIGGALALLSRYSWQQLLTSLSMIIAVLAAMGILIKKISSIDSKDLGKSMVALKMISKVIRSFSLTIILLSLIPWKRSLPAVGEMMLLMGAVMIMVALLAKISNTTSAGELAVIGVIIETIGSTISKLGLLTIAFSIINPLKLLTGIGGIVALLGSLTLVIFFLQKIAEHTSTVNMAEIATVLNSLTLTISVLGIVAIAIGKLKPESFKQSMIAIIGILGMITVVIGALTALSSIKGSDMTGVALAMLSLAASLLLIANAIKKLSAPNSYKGLLLIIGALASLVIVGGIIMATGLAPVLLAISAACMQIGIGFGALGVGALALVSAIILLSSSMTLLLNSLPVLITYISTFIGSLITALVPLIPAIVNFVTILISNIISSLVVLLPQITALLTLFILSLISAAKILLPEIVDLVIITINSIINGAKALIPNFVSLVELTINSILNFIETEEEAFITFITNFLSNLIDGIEKFILEEQQKFIDFVGEFILNILNGLDEYVPKIIEALWKLIDDTITGISDSAEKHTDNIVDAVDKLMLTVANAIKRHLTNTGKNFVKFLFGIETDANKEADGMEDAGENLVAGFEKGINQKTDDMEDAGKNLVAGFQKGIDEKADDVWKSISELVTQSMDLVTGKKGLDEHSPSKKTRQFAIWAVEGFILGLNSASIANQVSKTFVDPFVTVNKKIKNLVKDISKTMTVGTNAFKYGFYNMGNILQKFAKTLTNVNTNALYESMFKNTDYYKSYKKDINSKNKELNKLQNEQNEIVAQGTKLDKNFKKRNEQYYENQLKEKENQLKEAENKVNALSKTYTITTGASSSSSSKSQNTKTDSKSSSAGKLYTQKEIDDMERQVAAAAKENKFSIKYLTAKTKLDYMLKHNADIQKKMQSDSETESKSSSTSTQTAKPTTVTKTVGSSKEITDAKKNVNELKSEIDELKKLKKLSKENDELTNSINKITSAIEQLNKTYNSEFSKFVNQTNKKYGKNAIKAAAVLDKAIEENATKRYKETDAYKQYTENVKKQKNLIKDYNNEIDKINKKGTKKDKDFEKTSKKTYERELKDIKKKISAKDEEIKKAKTAASKETDAQKKAREARVKELEKEKDELNKKVDKINTLIEYKTNISDIKKEIEEANKEIKNLNKQQAEDISAVWDEYVATMHDSLKESTSMFANFIDNATDLTSKFEKGTRITADRIIKNLKSKSDAYIEWQTKLNAIQTKIDPSLFQYIRDLGVDGLNVVEAIYKASDAQIKEINYEWSRNAAINGQAWEQEIMNRDQITADMANMIIQLRTTYGNLFDQKFIDELETMGPDAYATVSYIFNKAVTGDVKTLNDLWDYSQSMPVEIANTLAAAQAIAKETKIDDYLSKEGIIISDAINTSNLTKTANTIKASVTSSKASNIAASKTGVINNNKSTITNTKNTSNNYTQNIYSPRALNNSEIYRQTHRLVSVNN